MAPRHLAAVAALLVAPLARADTIIVGGNVVNQTWTTAGSPYVLQGDVTVPDGATLTIGPGVEVRAAAGDVMGSGYDTSRVELVVAGALLAQGTAESPVVFTGAAATPGAWYGVVLASTAAGSVLEHVAVSHATFGLRHDATGSNTLDQLTVDAASTAGLLVTAGSPVITGLTVTASAVGVRVAGGSPAFSACLVRGAASHGVHTLSPAGPVVLDHCTLAGNAGDGLRAEGSGTVQLRDSVVSSNAGYGVYRSGAGGAVSVTYSDVWGNATAGFGNASPGVGCLSANPLLVSATLPRLTERSPARFAGSDGSDLGALPYLDDPTPQLAGVLWGDTELTAAGSPYVVEGDLTVPAGATLTLEPGVELRAAAGDLMGSGNDASRIELVVAGALLARGTAASPVTFSGVSAAAGAWYGVVLDPSAEGSVLEHVTISHAVRGLRHAATGANAFERITIHAASIAGLVVTGGSPVFTGLTVTSSGSGVQILGGTPSLSSCVLRGTSADGVWTSHASGTVVVDHCTIVGNAGRGVRAEGAGRLEVRNSIVASNGSYGVYRYALAGEVSVTYTDVWGNATAYSGVGAGTGCLSTNPLFVSADDLRLQGTSPCIDAGTSAPGVDADGVARPIDGDRFGAVLTDMGAYEYVPPAVCGDGQREGSEACDDGNADETDGCLSTCAAASCGDGYVHAGVEACDDGNAVETDGCLSTCAAAGCGDGYVHAGEEACDDGNAVETDGCLSTCAAASCGDGYVHAGEEACDDGNAVETDGCLSTCAAASCGDDYVHAGVEACDDGNLASGDGCDATCATEDPAPSASGGCGCGGGGGAASLAWLALLLLRRGRPGADRLSP